MSIFRWGSSRRVTGVSGSGKSSLVSQVLVELVAEQLGQRHDADEEEGSARAQRVETLGGQIAGGMDASSGWLSSIRSRLAARRARIWRPTPACSITCGRSLPRPRRRAPGATTPGGSPSTWPRAAANVRGRRLCHGRAVVPAERVRALPNLQGRALQRQDAGDPVSGQVDRRRAGNDGRCGVGAFCGGDRTCYDRWACCAK